MSREIRCDMCRELEEESTVRFDYEIKVKTIRKSGNNFYVDLCSKCKAKIWSFIQKEKHKEAIGL